MKWTFEEYVLDTVDASVRHNGKLLEIRPKTFDVLRYLVERQGELVQKEELFDAVWPNTYVVESVLSASMSELRKIFGDSAKSPRFIATVHRRGYRFIAPLSSHSGEEAPASHALRSQQQHRYAAPFVGREDEIAQLFKLVVDNPACRLLTLRGPGGIGKTRLVHALVDHMRDSKDALQQFPDGIVFIALQSVEDASAIPLSIASSLDIQLNDKQTPTEKILDFLEPLGLLLVLDNFEHLLDGSRFISAALSAAPRLKVITTSRVNLPLLENWTHNVDGLSIPDEGSENDKQTNKSDALALFEQCALREDTTFDLSTCRKDVLQLCRLLSGSPLAIELASSWLKALTPHEIAVELTQNLDILQSRNSDVAEQHQNLRMVFEHSWKQLSEHAQTVLCKLAVFRGGCTRAAAEQVTGAGLMQLSELIENSLLHFNQSKRYSLHELIRQFALQKLEQNSDNMNRIVIAHCTYYTDLLGTLERELIGPRQVAALETINTDIDNILMAWRTATEHNLFNAIAISIQSLHTFFEVRGMARDGSALFTSTLDKFTTGDIQAPSSVIGKLQIRSGNLLTRIGQYDISIERMLQGVDRLKEDADSNSADIAWTLSHVGVETYFKGSPQRARELLSECLDIAERIEDEWLIGNATLSLGQVAEFQGEYATAEAIFKRSLDAFTSLGERRSRAFALNNSGRVDYAMGNYESADARIVEALNIRTELGDQVGICYSLLDKGKLDLLLGANESAERAIQESLHIAETISELDLQARIHNGLGLLAQNLGNADNAEASHKRSLAIYEDIGVKRELPFTLNNLGKTHLMRKDTASAERYFLDSLQLARELENRGQQAAAMTNLGFVALSPNAMDPEKSLEFFNQALEIATETRAIPLLLETVAGACSALVEARLHNAAREYLDLIDQHPAMTWATRQYVHDNLKEFDQRTDASSPAQIDGDLLKLPRATRALLAQRKIL